jgi:hypothetical protein
MRISGSALMAETVSPEQCDATGGCGFDSHRRRYPCTTHTEGSTMLNIGDKVTTCDGYTGTIVTIGEQGYDQ